MQEACLAKPWKLIVWIPTLRSEATGIYLNLCCYVRSFVERQELSEKCQPGLFNQGDCVANARDREG